MFAAVNYCRRPIGPRPPGMREPPRQNPVIKTLPRGDDHLAKPQVWSSRTLCLIEPSGDHHTVAAKQAKAKYQRWVYIQLAHRSPWG